MLLRAAAGCCAADSGLSACAGRRAAKSQTRARSPVRITRRDFLPAVFPRRTRKKQRRSTSKGKSWLGKKQFDAALQKVKAARAISPLDTVYAIGSRRRSRRRWPPRRCARAIRRCWPAIADAALAAFRRAAEIDPTNEYAQQRLHDALPAPRAWYGAVSRQPRRDPAGAHGGSAAALSSGELDRGAGTICAIVWDYHGCRTRD